jgi:inorganic pyrophosphatase
MKFCVGGNSFLISKSSRPEIETPMNFNQIPPIENNLINAIIETPREIRYKYKYDPEKEIFMLNKVMPLGMVFPYDFGFIPNTKGEDGDPLDVMLLMEHEVFPGCLVQCRPIGILKAKQKEPGTEKFRNDRLLAVPQHSFQYADLTEIEAMSKELIKKIEDFFIDYNARQGREFEVIRWGGPEAAKKAVLKATVFGATKSK